MGCQYPNGIAYTKEGNTHFIPHEEYRAWEAVKETSDLRYHNMLKREGYTKIVPVGCGQCKYCKLQKSKEWANRICMELESYPEEECWFMTLTYNDENIPWVEGQIQEYQPGFGVIGVDIEEQTLDKRDLQLFLKRLRKRFAKDYNAEKIRFFAAGEYGGRSERPHYHVIFFGLPLEKVGDLTPYSRSELGYYRQYSPTIEQIWGKGFVDIGKVTWESAAYVARYTMKKATGGYAKEWSKKHIKEKEFIDMSRMPGIGRAYYEKHKEHLLEYDEAYVAKKDRAITVKMPKYFDRLFDVEYPERLEELKTIRQKVAEAKLEDVKRKTNLTSQEIRDAQALDLEARTKKLIRPL